MFMSILSASNDVQYPREVYKQLLGKAHNVDKSKLLPGMADMMEVIQGVGKGGKGHEQSSAAAMQRMMEREAS